MLSIIRTCLLVYYSNYNIMQISGGENFGEFGESNVIGQYFTPSNSEAAIC